MSSPPFEEADEADLAEQRREVVEDDSPRTPPHARLDEANEADALEQGAEVGEDEEY